MNDLQKEYLINLTYEDILILTKKRKSSVSRFNEIIEKINQTLKGTTKDID